MADFRHRNRFVDCDESGWMPAEPPDPIRRTLRSCTIQRTPSDVGRCNLRIPRLRFEQLHAIGRQMLFRDSGEPLRGKPSVKAGRFQGDYADIGMRQHANQPIADVLKVVGWVLGLARVLTSPNAQTQAPAFGTPGGLGIRAEKPCIACGIGQMDVHRLAPVLRISIRFAVRRGVRRDILAHACERRFVIYENLGEPRVLPPLREYVAKRQNYFLVN